MHVIFNAPVAFVLMKNIYLEKSYLGKEVEFIYLFL